MNRSPSDRLYRAARTVRWLMRHPWGHEVIMPEAPQYRARTILQDGTWWYLEIDLAAQLGQAGLDCDNGRRRIRGRWYVTSECFMAALSAWRLL